VSIDGYADHAPQNSRNLLDSTNTIMYDDASDNLVIELSHCIDDSQHIFAKAKSLLMEQQSIFNT
jgi:hypothetical protein